MMQGVRFICWEDGDFWLGYLQDYPQYMTQGESLADLRDHLEDLYRELTDQLLPVIK